MTTSGDGAGLDHAWFLGSMFGGTDDQSARFMRESVWEHGHQDRDIENMVKSIRPGDRVALKKTWNKLDGLPFDNRGRRVSTMTTRATGFVRDNPGHGRPIQVEWTRVDPPRDWFLHTYLKTIWRVESGKWPADEFLKFTFADEPQDIERFRNSSY